MGDWFYDHLGWIIVAIIVLIVTGIVVTEQKAEKEFKTDCDKAWDMTRTHEDSMQTFRICSSLRPKDRVVPIPVVIPSGR